MAWLFTRHFVSSRYCWPLRLVLLREWEKQPGRCRWINRFAQEWDIPETHPHLLVSSRHIQIMSFPHFSSIKHISGCSWDLEWRTARRCFFFDSLCSTKSFDFGLIDSPMMGWILNTFPHPKTPGLSGECSVWFWETWMTWPKSATVSYKM